MVEATASAASPSEEPARAKWVAVAPESRVEFHPLVVHREPGREPMLGCPRVRRYVEVDDETLRVIDAIQSTTTLEEAEAATADENGDTVDVVALVQFLRDRGFVRAIDGVMLDGAEDARERHPFLHKVPPSALTWLHSPLTLMAVLAVGLSWIGLMIFVPGVRVGFEDIRIFSRTSAVLAASFGGLLLLAYVHELAHFFVARSFGIEATIAVSHRFYLLVLQTDVTNAWTLPPRRRLAVFLAGIAFNVTAAGLAAITLALGADGVLSLTPRTEAFLRFFIVLNAFPLLLQLFIPARTDLYHVLLVLTKERNLLADSLLYLKFLFLRAWRIARAAPRAPCEACGRACVKEDPFCFSCHAPRRVEDPNKFPFRASQRRLLPIVGVGMFLGTLVGYYFFGRIILRILTILHGSSWISLQRALATADWFFVFEAVLALALIALQAMFAAYFMTRGVYNMFFAGPLGIGVRWLAPRVTEGMPPVWRSRVLKIVMRAFPNVVTTFERVRTTFEVVRVRTTFHVVRREPPAESKPAPWSAQETSSVISWEDARIGADAESRRA